ncbi:hypothetical protein DRO24_01640 [Candidatus Bathyarchaeota archaeon]|nr:MAG: hypothetical protein DRO24_01640 [Candidatus Bathyarchaeota archaeon]
MLAPRGYRKVDAVKFVEALNPRETITADKLQPAFELYSIIIEPYDIASMLNRLVDCVDYSRCFFADQLYIAYQLADYGQWLTWSGISKKPYQELKHDCDDFALEAKAYLHFEAPMVIPAFGIIWLVEPKLRLAHALNLCVAVGSDGVIDAYLYEPQLNEFYRHPSNKWRLYLLLT